MMRIKTILSNSLFFGVIASSALASIYECKAVNKDNDFKAYLVIDDSSASFSSLTLTYQNNTYRREGDISREDLSNEIPLNAKGFGGFKDRVIIEENELLFRLANDGLGMFFDISANRAPGCEFFKGIVEHYNQNIFDKQQSFSIECEKSDG
jgi:hypothetical protein